MKVDIFNTDKKYNIIYADPPWEYKDLVKDIAHILCKANSHYDRKRREWVYDLEGVQK